MKILNTLRLQKEELNRWRRKGGLRKLHNLMIFIRASTQRRELFLPFTEADGNTKELLLFLNDQEKITATMFIKDNDTKWNSCYMMIERALKKGEKLNFLYHVQKGYYLKNEFLWKIN